jgi:hypothetical protein
MLLHSITPSPAAHLLRIEGVIQEHGTHGGNGVGAVDGDPRAQAATPHQVGQGARMLQVWVTQQHQVYVWRHTAAASEVGWGTWG